MSERKYTDEEIVKALECCQHRECQECIRLYTGRPIEDDCRLDLIYDSLTFIKCQNAGIDKLQEVNADLNESLRLAAEANKDLKAEIERLTKERDAMRSTAYLLKKHYEWAVKAQETSVKAFSEFIHAVRSDAINEFAERVINLIYSADDINPITEWQIYDLVAEMTEGK